MLSGTAAWERLMQWGESAGGLGFHRFDGGPHGIHEGMRPTLVSRGWDLEMAGHLMHSLEALSHAA